MESPWESPGKIQHISKPRELVIQKPHPPYTTPIVRGIVYHCTSLWGLNFQFSILNTTFMSIILLINKACILNDFMESYLLWELRVTAVQSFFHFHIRATKNVNLPSGQVKNLSDHPVNEIHQIENNSLCINQIYPNLTNNI